MLSSFDRHLTGIRLLLILCVLFCAVESSVKGYKRGSKPPRQMEQAEARETITQLVNHGVKEVVFAVRGLCGDNHWYANMGYFAWDSSKHLAGKYGRLCKLNIQTGKVAVLIDDPGGTIRDPAVHYDAQKMIFSWKKSGQQAFNLYECTIDGKNITQITDSKYDDYEPCYLPDGGIIFISARSKRWVNCWVTQVGTIHRCDGDGKNVRELSANIEHDNTPWVLSDGRIIYMRWEYVDRSQVDYHHHWAMNPDGTSQMVYFGNLHAPGLYIDAKPVPGSDKIVFINSPGHGRAEHEGMISLVSDKKGPDHKPSLRDISTAGFRDPWPFSENLFIAAFGRTMYALNGKGRATQLYQLPADVPAPAQLHEPRPVIIRKREPVIPPRVNLASNTGKLILNNVYLGRNMTGVKKGDIKKLLVLETLPKPINFTGGMDPLTYGGSFTMERILGTVPVEEDGSAFMELPANRALFFVAMDENNNSVKRMQSFLTVMPGEVTSCIGCHENRDTTPVGINTGALAAMKREASKVEKIEGIPDIFDFPRDIQPILDKHCIKCHDYDKRKGGVILTGDRGPMFSHSYITLTLKRQFADGRNLRKSNYPPRTLGTSASPLMKKIDGSHHDVKVSRHEENMIRYWIESAALYPGTYAALGHGSIGGYQQNKQIHKDTDWPTAPSFRSSVSKRCSSCHKSMPSSISDEIRISFWRFDMNDIRLKYSRHLMFNLTRPEKSLLLLAPLSKQAGGLGLCKTRPDKSGAEATVFADTNDKDYRAMLTHITAGRDYLENKLTRFDMPNFMPRPEYFREMKRYGVLDESFDPKKDKFDVYDIERRYWESLWWKKKQANE